ncbi:MAG TPA: class I SAM-dependent methyltransferase [Candidatus Limnocylindria bacterium]|nr:class I SAM-dependent methyltransferase [Candidatus Limnocylindria bacterium]
MTLTAEEEQRFRFSSIAHGEMVLWNPFSTAALSEAIEELRLSRGARVLDLGCGRGEALRRVVERYDAHGVGVDLSPFAIAQARAASMELRHGTLELLEADALDYRPDEPFDVVMALGPGWEHDSFQALLRQLYGLVSPAGLLLLADGYWRREPTLEYLSLLGASRQEMGTHAEHVREAIDLGLMPLWAATASTRDWDRYEWRYLGNVERWAGEHPADPQHDEFLARARAGRDRYLAGGRELLGFGIYLFRVSG